MDVLARTECPEHGDRLTAARRWEPRRWCLTCAQPVDPVVVRYVRADAYQGAVDLLRAFRASILARGDGRELASADDERMIERIDAVLGGR